MGVGVGVEVGGLNGTLTDRERRCTSEKRISRKRVAAVRYFFTMPANYWENYLFNQACSVCASLTSYRIDLCTIDAASFARAGYKNTTEVRKITHIR